MTILSDTEDTLRYEEAVLSEIIMKLYWIEELQP